MGHLADINISSVRDFKDQSEIDITKTQSSEIDSPIFWKKKIVDHLPKQEAMQTKKIFTTIKEIDPALHHKQPSAHSSL